jgi:TRAP-type C4-dicarboxylate transport system permease small subunit
VRLGILRNARYLPDFAVRTLPPPEAAMTRTVGVILIVLGLLGLAWGGFNYTTREKVVDIGPIHATREETHNVPIPPIAGALALIGGIVLLVVGGKE